MAEIVWQNTFDGTSGTVTAANSGNYGDPIAQDSISTSKRYQNTVRRHGAGAVENAFGVSEQTLTPLHFWQGTGAVGFAYRIYIFYVPEDTDQFRAVVLSYRNGPSNSTLLYLNRNSRQFLNSILTPEVFDELANRWVRVEFLANSGTLTGRIWYQDPDSDGPPDVEASRAYPTGPLDTGVGYYNTRVTDEGVNLYYDSVAIGSGDDWIGPYTPGEQTLVQNTFNGPDGTTVTLANSGDYGTPLTGASQSPQYSDTWTALGGGSSVQLLGASTAPPTITWGASAWGGHTVPYRSQWSARFYYYVPDNNGRVSFNANSQPAFNVNGFGSTFDWAGGSLSAIAADLVGQTVRVEFSIVDYTATMRLWWTDPHSEDAPDFEDSTSNASWSALQSFQFLGTGNQGSGGYVDEVDIRESGWIGPAIPNSTAEIGVAFGGSATGTVDVAGIVATDVAYSGESAGTKSVAADVEATIMFAGDVEHDARETGLARHELEYSGEAAGTASRTDDSVVEIEYSGEVDWVTERSSEGGSGVVYDGQASGESRITLPDVTRVGLRYRLRVYDPNGDARGQIPLPLNFTLGVPLNDLPSLSLEYLRSVPGFERLDGYCEVAVELATLRSPEYIEYPGMRFINIRNQSDPAERTGNVKYTMPHYGWQLRKARVLTGFDEEGQRAFTNSTFGRIMDTFLREAQERGWNPGMSWDFTPQRDSAGQVWDEVYTVTFDAGQDLWTILETFAQQAACDFQFDRRTLRLFNTDTALNRDRSNQAVLHLGRDITSAPNDWSSEELASRILVRGDEGAQIIWNVNDAQQPWGSWESYISQSGVTDSATLSRLAQWTLRKTSQPLVQMTRGILFPTTEYMPFRDYQPGDYITAPGDPEQPWGSTSQGDLRVQQITLVSVDHQGMEGALVLNERFVENALRRDRILNALTGGSGSNPGGGGGGTPPREDTRTPRAPDGLVVTSDTYINEIGEPRGQITATWQAVTEATNGTDMDIRAYEVFVRWSAFNEPFSLYTTVDDPDVQAFMGPFDPDEVYEVRVRAVGRNQRRSVFTPTVAVFVDRDAEAPDVPSAPILDSRLGVVRLTWDGLSEFGTPMPSDFNFVTVWMSETASEDDGWEPVDTLYRQGVSAIPDLPYDTEFYFRLTAIDRSGNESEPSAMGSISVQQLVPGDITPGSIGYELLAEGAVRDDILADDAVRNRHVAAGEITGEKIRAYSIFADRIAVGNTRNLLTDPKHTDEDLNALRLDYAGGVWAYNYDEFNAQDAPYLSREDNDNGTYQYYWVQSVEAESITDPHGYIPVAAEMGRLVATGRVTISGMTSGSIALTIRAGFLDRQGGVIAGAPAVIGTTTYNGNASDVEITSNNGAGIPDAASYALLYAEVVLTGVNDSAWVRISRPFAALTNGQVLIENGAISANKIAANAITADKIDVGAVTAVAIAADAITTDKLAANAITAKHTITGALIQTTASANRGLKISSSGMRGYDSVGNQTLSYSTSTGNVSITGEYRTGLSGEHRVLISPNANFMDQPGIRLFSGSSGARDSSLFIADAQGSGGWDPFDVVLTGSETTRNSSGRTDLVIHHGTGDGGGAELRYNRGNRGSVGYAYRGWELQIRGRNSSGQTAYDSFLWYRSDTRTGGGVQIVSWTFTYGTAAPNGDRLAMLVGHTNLVSNQLVECSVSVQNPGNFSATARSNGTYRLQYLATWVDGNV